MTDCTYWPTCHSEATGTDFDEYGEYRMNLLAGSLPVCARHAEEFMHEPGPWDGWAHD